MKDRLQHVKDALVESDWDASQLLGRVPIFKAFAASVRLVRTAVLSKTSHANSYTTLTNRPPRSRRGRFGRVVQQLACEVFARKAVVQNLG